MFSTGKLGSYVSFPLDNLNMQPFVHKGIYDFPKILIFNFNYLNFLFIDDRM